MTHLGQLSILNPFDRLLNEGSIVVITTKFSKTHIYEKQSGSWNNIKVIDTIVTRSFPNLNEYSKPYVAMHFNNNYGVVASRGAVAAPFNPSTFDYYSYENIYNP